MQRVGGVAAQHSVAAGLVEDSARDMVKWWRCGGEGFEHRVLELLKNLALGRIFQQMQASFRRKMGRHVTPYLSHPILHHR